MQYAWLHINWSIWLRSIIVDVISFYMIKLQENLAKINNEMTNICTLVWIYSIPYIICKPILNVNYRVVYTVTNFRLFLYFFTSIRFYRWLNLMMFVLTLNCAQSALFMQIQDNCRVNKQDNIRDTFILTSSCTLHLA